MKMIREQIITQESDYYISFLACTLNVIRTVNQTALEVL